MRLPEARRATSDLTFWQKGIAGFHRIEGHPGIWVWRQLSTAKTSLPKGMAGVWKRDCVLLLTRSQIGEVLRPERSKVMGYTITIEVSDHKLAQKMIDFLKANCRSFDFLTGQAEENEWYDGPYWANGKGDEDSKKRKGLSYCHRMDHIGFDYGCDREYKYTLLRWMAQKIGDRDPKTKNPRYLYDDSEWIQIEPKTHDKLGLRIDDVDPFCWIMPEHKEIARKEMIRLNQLWEELK